MHFRNHSFTGKEHWKKKILQDIYGWVIKNRYLWWNIALNAALDIQATIPNPWTWTTPLTFDSSLTYHENNKIWPRGVRVFQTKCSSDGWTACKRRQKWKWPKYWKVLFVSAHPCWEQILVSYKFTESIPPQVFRIWKQVVWLMVAALAQRPFAQFSQGWKCWLYLTASTFQTSAWGYFQEISRNKYVENTPFLEQLPEKRYFFPSYALWLDWFGE